MLTSIDGSRERLAEILGIGLFTTAGIGVSTLFERRFLGWRPSQRYR